MSNDAEPRKSVLQRLWSVVDPNERYLRSIQPQVEQINALESEFEQYTQRDLQDRLRKIRSEVQQARDAVEAAQAQLPAAEDSDTRQRRHDEIIAAEKAVLDAHLTEVFAAVREAAKRTLSMRPFDVQMLGGIVLHEGRIAEMKTGEGKTLTATCPLVLNSLASRGAHVVTVNDYLARRDAEWMGKIYRYLGLTVGVIQHDLSREVRQHAYRCDITYITNHEIGFDYLRDHSSAWRPEHLVLREQHYAIIDEVDSILIDEARVPLIISASRGKPVEKYRKVQDVVARLVEGGQDIETKETWGDLYTDEKAKNATLTEEGQRKVEIALGIENLNDSAHIEDMHLVNAALKANFVYRRDVDYIVGPGDGGIISVIIVDSFTGRPQAGRRWSDGLHQAIEAKERVQIQDEQQTIATVTYQNFFLMYNRLSGMTGTAKTEEGEFVEIYSMPVVVVPTNRPLRRLGHPDVVYRSQEWKYRGICAEIAQNFCRRQPVLVGTRSVETSELLSARLTPQMMKLNLQALMIQWHIMEHEKKIDKELLKELRAQSTVPLEALRPKDMAGFMESLGLDPDIACDANVAQLTKILELEDEQALRDVLQHGVPHEVLNARHHEREAQIVAQAGRLGAVTIATNMAGRGTDIVLGGNPEPDVEDLLADRGVDPKSLEATLFINQALRGDAAQARSLAASHGHLPETVLAEIAAIRDAWSSEHRDVLATGGLHILGTERLESRRIDNQLRGRSGRQGDPGSSRFYISLEDELMRLFGPDRFKLLMNQWPEEQPVEANMITKAMNNAQKKVEGRNYEIRKNTLRYDDVMNVQRKHIYSERRMVLEGYDLRGTVSGMMRVLVQEAIDLHLPPELRPEEWDLGALWAQMNARFPIKDQLAFEDLVGLDREALSERLLGAAERSYDDKENDFIRSVVEFELQANIHETLQQVPRRDILCDILNQLWPLQEYLPAGLDGVPDNKVPEALLGIARQALESDPRAFILEAVQDRLVTASEHAARRLAEGEDPAAVAASLDAVWPAKITGAQLAGLGDSPAEEIEELLGAALDAGGWAFANEALHLQMDASIAATLPLHCDLEALCDELDDLWPLGTDLAPDALASQNYGVIADRLHRMAEQALRDRGEKLLPDTAEHRLRRLAAAIADGLPDSDAHAAVILRQPDVALAPADDVEAFVEAHYEQAETALILGAVEAVAMKAVVDAHRAMTQVADEDAGEDEDELAFGDLNRLIDRLKQSWALGEALDPWQLERLAPAAVRGEMAERVQAEIRRRGLSFVTESAQLRLRWMITEAIFDHYSLRGLCARLNRELELPAVFVPESYADVAPGPELVAVLMEAAGDALADEPERLEQVPQEVQAAVFENLNAKRLCDRINADLKPARKIEPRDLAGIAESELEAAILAWLGDDIDERFEEAFILDAVGEHLRLTIEQALDRHYDLRAVSATLTAAWPVRPDAVRASKLKGWAYCDLQQELSKLLRDACQAEPWRFVRSFTLRMLAAGLAEAMAVHVPDGSPPSRWNVVALCEELNQRWPDAGEPLVAKGLPEFSRAMLVDRLMGWARSAYGECERAFVRHTAEHRFAQRLEIVRRERYSLDAAAEVISQRWRLGDAVQAASLAAARAVLGDDAAFQRVVQGLVEPVLETAERSLLDQALVRRIQASADEVLDTFYNPSLLGGRLCGDWPLPGGGLNGELLRRMPFREMTDRVRAFVQGATGALRRRVAYHNLRQTTAIVDPAGYLPAGRPAEWRFADLAAQLDPHLPLRHLASAGQLAGDVLSQLLAESVKQAAATVRPDDRATMAKLVSDRVAAEIDVILATERRPSQVIARLAERWPIADRIDSGELRGKSVSQVIETLVKAAEDGYAKSPDAFITRMAALWVQRSVDEAMRTHWPSADRSGPWDLAQVVQAVNTRWEQPDGVHPTQLKGLERGDVQAWLSARAAAMDPAQAARLCVAELANDQLTAALRQAAGEAAGGGAFDPQAFATKLGQTWPGQTPNVDAVAGGLTSAGARDVVADRLGTAEGRVVAEYETEAVQQWLEARVDRALEASCSLTQTARELAARWPVGELDPTPLAALEFVRVRQALLDHLVRAAIEGGDAFVLQAARQNLAADQETLRAMPEDRAVVEALAARWPLPVTSGVSVETIEAAARAIDDATLQRAFFHDTLRMRLRQAVDEAQREHANPEIAADRWDLESFVGALARDWPLAGELTVAKVAGLNSEQVRETALAALLHGFEAAQDRFIAATARLQLGHTIAQSLRDHATLEGLAPAVAEAWPREETFAPEALAAGRGEAMARLLQRIDPTLDEAAAETLASGLLRSGEPDLVGLAKQVAERLGVPTPSTDEVDELLVSQVLQRRLDDSFAEDPHAFVKAVALEDVPRQLERRLMLEAIDTNWCNHLEAMDYLREGINLRGYGQVDPFIAYRKDGRTMFENMLGRVRETVVAGLFETTEQQLVDMHSHGRLGLRIAIEFQNVQESAAKAEQLTGSHAQAQPILGEGESEGARRRERREREKTRKPTPAEVETSNIQRLRRGG